MDNDNDSLELLKYLFTTEEGAEKLGRLMTDTDLLSEGVVKMVNDVVASTVPVAFKNSCKLLMENFPEEEVFGRALLNTCTSYMLYGYAVRAELARLGLEKSLGGE